MGAEDARPHQPQGSLPVRLLRPGLWRAGPHPGVVRPYVDRCFFHETSTWCTRASSSSGPPSSSASSATASRRPSKSLRKEDGIAGPAHTKVVRIRAREAVWGDARIVDEARGVLFEMGVYCAVKSTRT